MANPYRPPVRTGFIDQNARLGPPAFVPIVRAQPFGIPQAHQYVPHHNYSVPFQTTPVPGPLQNTVPVPRMYGGGRVIRAPNSPMDPVKFIEEQRRFEKERNFQMQQQKLKQFTVSGKKGNLKADSLIDSMFGKPKQTTPMQGPPPSTFNVPSVPENFTAFIPRTVTTNVSQTDTKFHEADAKSQNVSNSATTFIKKDKKKLESMMIECSNLTGPQKASKFTKPAVKEIVPTAHHRSQFIASNKACDWKNLQGLEEAFVEKRPRFPLWCSSDHVPDVYKKIEEYVTESHQHPPDTKLLFPILLSSCLQQAVLGNIWEMVSKSSPGHLTNEEMYAALALIAVAQAGHPVKSTDILHQLPACPTPQLQCFSSPPTSSENPEEKAKIDSEPTLDKEAVTASGNPETSTHQVIRPTAIPLSKILGPNGNQTPSPTGCSASGFISSPDDEFDDFKSATPTAVNFALPTPTSEISQTDDEFDDFKQAPTSNLPFVTNVNTAILSVPPEHDLMSPDEDKYGAFRILQQDNSSWSNLTEENTDSSKDKSLFNNSSGDRQIYPVSNKNLGLFKSNETPKENSDDEFGDFIHVPSVSDAFSGPEVVENLSSDFANFANFSEANFEPTSDVQANDDFSDFTSCAPVLDNLQGQQPPANLINNQKPVIPVVQLEDDFGDFASFNCASSSQFVNKQSASIVPTIKAVNQTDNEFGDFASSAPVLPCKTELGHEFGFFQNGKDNISLAESQSVSSLELGVFDNGGQSGDSKSSLSRQGSIPSLDLKSSAAEGAEGEDGFGEFQNVGFAVQTSESPSLSKDLKDAESNNIINVPLQPYQPPTNVSLVDKYSVIRAEVKKDEDQHISSWVRCLQSSVNILKNTKRIFNQMSCSSVCNEVLHTEEGENYIKDVIEVYKVACRIAAASKSANKQTVEVLDLIKEANNCWNTICVFFAGTSLMPEEKSLDFSEAVLHAGMEDNMKACGLCLLNVDAKSSSTCKDEIQKLSYGGRNYHNTCANLWVNCVEPLLPTLCLPQLL